MVFSISASRINDIWVPARASFPGPPHVTAHAAIAKTKAGSLMRTLLHPYLENRHDEAKAILPRRAGQTALAALCSVAFVAVSACDPQKPAQGVSGYVAGFAGFVSAEEPRAALIGQDTLGAGGTAADAAVAMASALTVTMPGRAGWMGGGVCLSRMPKDKDKSVQAFSFLPQRLPGGGFVPGMPRGLYALHAASGVLRWEQILAPAEQLARFGAPVSRALAKDLATLGSPSALDEENRAVYTRADGSLLHEGDSLIQLRIAAALTSLRMKGAGEAYSGKMGYLIAGEMPEQEEARRAVLRAYRVDRSPALSVDVGNETAYFPNPPFPGAQASKIWTAAVESKSAKRPTLPGPALSAYGATGFVVVDRGGMAVSCALSMGQMFGGGRSVGELGLFAYSPMGDEPDADVMLPMIVTNRHVKDLRLAAAGAGASGVADVLDFAARGLLAGQKAQDAVAAAAAAGEAASRVTGVICPEGAPANLGSCTLPMDPRGAGVSRAVGRETDRSKVQLIF
jgi:gamma-glutamyltranspeptidase/glutathione hydrolase